MERVYKLDLGGIHRSILGLGGQLNIPIVLICSVWVAGSLQVNRLGMGIDLLYQLPQASRLLFIGNNGGLLGDNRKAGKWDLVWVYQRGVLGDTYGLKGYKPPLFENQFLSLINDKLRRILYISEAFVVSFALTTLQSRPQISQLLCPRSIQTFCLGQFQLSLPHFSLQIRKPLLRQCFGLLGRGGLFLHGRGNFRFSLLAASVASFRALSCSTSLASSFTRPSRMWVN